MGLKQEVYLYEVILAKVRTKSKNKSPLYRLLKEKYT